LKVITDLDELGRLVRAGKVEVVLCSGLNGLGRRSPADLMRVLKEFVAQKVALIIPSQDPRYFQRSG
jgi:hypothetical protein